MLKGQKERGEGKNEEDFWKSEFTGTYSRFTPYRGVCGTGGLFFCTFLNPYYIIAADARPVYPCDPAGCDGGGDTSVSKLGGRAYRIHCGSGLRTVRQCDPDNDHRGPVVCGEGSTFHDVRTEPDL